MVTLLEFLLALRLLGGVAVLEFHHFLVVYFQVTVVVHLNGKGIFLIEGDTDVSFPVMDAGFFRLVPDDFGSVFFLHLVTRIIFSVERVKWYS